jgi:ectoine hydroxylase-related dioxygenase (phytanoyl-CoA dioxygenase family)
VRVPAREAPAALCWRETTTRTSEVGRRGESSARREGARGLSAMATDTPLLLEVGNRLLPFDGVTLGWMNEFDGPRSAEAMQRAMDRDGYLLLRDLVPTRLVADGCAAITEELRRNDWLEGTVDPAAELRLKPNAGTAGMLRPHEADVLINDPAVRAVLHGPELRGVFEELFGEPACCLDFKWFRAVVPEQYSGFHMDYVYMGAGSSRIHTVWLPWHDIDVELGGLVMLEGSNRLPGFQRMRETYGSQQHGQWWGVDSAELLAFDPGARWVTANFRRGDALIFPMHTMHGSMTNKTADRLRLACDSRFQPANDPLDPRCAQSSPKTPLGSCDLHSEASWVASEETVPLFLNDMHYRRCHTQPPAWI